jgi:hypothetical protein
LEEEVTPAAVIVDSKAETVIPGSVSSMVKPSRVIQETTLTGGVTFGSVVALNRTKREATGVPLAAMPEKRAGRMLARRALEHWIWIMREVSL